MLVRAYPQYGRRIMPNRSIYYFFMLWHGGDAIKNYLKAHTVILQYLNTNTPK